MAKAIYVMINYWIAKVFKFDKTEMKMNYCIPGHLCVSNIILFSDHKLQKLVFLHLFSELFQNDYFSIVRIQCTMNVPK